MRAAVARKDNRMTSRSGEVTSHGQHRVQRSLSIHHHGRREARSSARSPIFVLYVPCNGQSYALDTPLHRNDALSSSILMLLDNERGKFIVGSIYYFVRKLSRHFQVGNTSNEFVPVAKTTCQILRSGNHFLIRLKAYLELL